jgi:hypothetical protein
VNGSIIERTRRVIGKLNVKPARLFPSRSVLKEMGAKISLSIVPLLLSRGRITAAIVVPPKKVDKTVTPTTLYSSVTHGLPARNAPKSAKGKTTP